MGKKQEIPPLKQCKCGGTPNVWFHKGNKFVWCRECNRRSREYVRERDAVDEWNWRVMKVA